MPIHRLAFSPDGKTLAAPESSNGHKPTSTLHLWDVASGQLHSIAGQPEYLCQAVFSPDSKTVASRSDRGVVLWDVATGKERGRLGGHYAYAHALTFSSDSKLLATIGGSIRLWDVATGKERPAPADGHHGWIWALTFLEGGKTLASASRDGTLRIWDVVTGRPVRRHPFTVPLLTVPSDVRLAGGAVLAWCDGKRIGRVDVATGQPLRPLELPDDVYHIAVTQGGRLLAAHGRDRTLRLVDHEGKVVREFPRKKDQAVYRLEFAPHGRTLALALEDEVNEEALVLVDTTTGQRRVLLRSQGPPGPLTFSPDGKTLIVVLRDKRLVLLEVATGKERLSLPSPTGVAELLCSPDGKRLAVAAGYGRVHLWELATGKELRRLEGHHGQVSCLAFSADGRRLASGGNDTTVLTWDVGNDGTAPPAPVRHTRAELDALWTALASEDATGAYRAIHALAAAPEQALPLLRQRLTVDRALDPERLARLIADLDDRRFAVREQATRELELLGPSARPALEQTLARRPSLEMRRRAEALLQRLQPLHSVGEELRQGRAIEVLEQIGTADARVVLERLVRDGPDTPLTRDPRNALERLERRD